MQDSLDTVENVQIFGFTLYISNNPSLVLDLKFKKKHFNLDLPV